jgi:protein-tyrosine-phosphatase
MTIQTPMARPPIVIRLLAHNLRWQLVSALARSDRRAQELVAILGQPANLVSYHLQRLKRARLVRQRRSAADRRATYYSLNLPQVQALYAQAGQALHPALSGTHIPVEPTVQEEADRPSRPPARVLFLCTHNSARSQMAEAALRHLSKGEVEAFSAGNEPTQLHPLAIQAMDKRGIDIRRQQSKHLSQYLGQHFDYIITVCDLAREACPVFPGDPEQIHWSFPDPAAVEGTQARQRAFETFATELITRINFLLVLIRRKDASRSQGAIDHP